MDFLFDSLVVSLSGFCHLSKSLDIEENRGVFIEMESLHFPGFFLFLDNDSLLVVEEFLQSLVLA